MSKSTATLLSLGFAAAFAAGIAAVPAAAQPPAAAPAAQPASCPAVLHHTFKRLQDEAPQDLCQYSGKVVLVVNTASECGYTPQYAELEQLYAKYKDRGLVVLGFPSNDFGGQEPGSDQDVLSFSQAKYGVSFPMFSKSVVKGDSASPVYRFLAQKHGEPAWNFHKYLVDRHGKVIAAFPSAVAPLDASLIQAVERALTSA